MKRSKSFFAKLFLFFFFIIVIARPANASVNDVNVYLFWGDGCPHCAAEKPFLEELDDKYSNLNLFEYEVWNNSFNRNLFVETGRKLNTDVAGVPFTVVGDEVFIGFSKGITTNQIEERVKYCSSNICPDSVANIVGVSSGSEDAIKNIGSIDKKIEQIQERESKQIMPEKIKFPIIGEANTKNISLPVFAIVFGALDGFNPCAMWALIFLISLLLGMHNKKRRWILGSAFIVSSALVYFIFMAAWLNILIFVGLIVWVRILIGGVAITGGLFNLREYLINKNNSCKVTGGERRRQVFEKLKNITHNQKFFLALIGIITLAFSVNLVELICSAGLPVIFTQVLALSDLPSWQYYFYMLVYIFFFMLDDLIVFFLAMVTLEITGISTKYSRYSHLIGGILMLFIGWILIFKPEWLMFG